MIFKSAQVGLVSCLEQAGSKHHCDLKFLLLPIFHVINIVITEHNTYLAH